jgi:20S proteasome subunit beta 6
MVADVMELEKFERTIMENYYDGRQTIILSKQQHSLCRNSNANAPTSGRCIVQHDVVSVVSQQETKNTITRTQRQHCVGMGSTSTSRRLVTLWTIPSKLILFLVLVLQFQSLSVAAAGDFEPYQMNGGLVSAVAGQDYVVLATDTRLSSGYEILTRHHTSSRLWRVNSGASVSGIMNTKNTNNGNDNESDNVNVNIHPLRVTDGAFVLSAGCQSDCEALKRQMQAEVRCHAATWNSGVHKAGTSSGSASCTLSASSVATLLGQTLYARRAFPFYAFCIVAGLNNEEQEQRDSSSSSRPGGGTQSGDGEKQKHAGGGGVVHVYDAVGSHERVAVAAAGTGKEMLQPILDRLFSVSNLEQTVDVDSVDVDISVDSADVDANAISPQDQRRGVGLLLPPVKTCVDCSAEQAVQVLLQGYRSVAEREIAVGDEVLMYILRRRPRSNTNNMDGDGNGHGTLEIKRFPLKKH